MSKLIGRLLNTVQRQSFVISLTAFFTGLLLIAMVSILVLITMRGGAYFWPSPIYNITYSQQGTEHSSRVLGQLYIENDANNTVQIKYADSEQPFGAYLALDKSTISSKVLAVDSAEIKFTDGRVMLARPLDISTPNKHSVDASEYDIVAQDVAKLTAEINRIRTGPLAQIHEALARLDERNVEQEAPAREKLIRRFDKWQKTLISNEIERSKYLLNVGFLDGGKYAIDMSDILDVHYVSRLSFFEKTTFILSGITVFLTDTPKQANTSGGVFPALFGTVLMVFLMTIIVTPFGVLAAVYLSEYAPNNAFTSVIRISVSNMAGVPSIVYGVFGLGFFVYTVGGNIDSLFFSDSLPAPTMGSPGVFWAALTMAILTLPVVIVATEEGLRRVPEGLKAGSYALGATKYETTVKTILPIASPAIMTGVILAIARAAGEVAPLMLVGAVKFAPALPIDGEFPYLHLDRQFMHLGVLIYDGAFHSQTDTKSASMMFAACLLLLMVVFVLNILAVILRTRLRKQYLEG